LVKAVDRAFIERAVEASDLEALRAALYQASRDAELAEFGPVSTLLPRDRARLVAKAVGLLESDLERYESRIPSDEEVREIMDLALGVPTLDEHFEIRKKLLAFEKFPFLYERPDGKLEVPEDFEVAIIGAGLAGVAAAVQLDHLGIPYVIYERQDQIGGTWNRTRYPDIRVDTLSITYEFSFDEQYPWSEYFAPGAEVREYIEFIARKYGVFDRIRFGHDLRSARFDEARSTWHLTLAGSEGGLEEREVNAIVSAAGLFATAKLPDIPGIEDVEDIIVSSGPNAWPNWRNFSDRIVRPGEIVFMDLAALTWNGYKSCYYRTYCVGRQPTQEMKDYYATALEWLYNSIDAVKAGATTRDIASKWPSAKEAWGYEEEDQAAANLWGHGLGLAQYDPPVISRIWSLDHPVEIKAGMVFALETQHGKRFEWGVRIEEMLIVHEDRIEIISTFPVEQITVVDPI